MPTDSAPHLIVPFAQCSDDDWLQVVTSLEFKNLNQLLRGMKLIANDSGPADSLSPPHERVLAKALGLAPSADGLIPWAAFEANGTPEQAWALITPCHWAMGREHATLTDPATLGMTETESTTLLAAMQPYFATEGITLQYLQPARWLAKGEVFRTLPTASLDRVMGRNVDRWLPASKAIKLLQNEMQMLLYTHPVNDHRAANGKPSVNSFWVSGSGALKDAVTGNPNVMTNTSLTHAAFTNDGSAYREAWVQLEAGAISQFLAQQKGGQTVRLSLCGESNAMTFETTQHGFLAGIKAALSPQNPVNLLKQL